VTLTHHKETTQMKHVTNRPCFQGELMIRRIDTIPDGMKRVDATDGLHIMAHSESGHHHVVESRAADKFIDETNAFIAYLDVADDTELKHLRDFDTHESWLLTPGRYETIVAREHVPEGWRRTAD
jgi:hypothetical protein